ncbi:hypothetical protein M0R45_016144 [Rubus argutus]|uniref:Uncharacterized protein n=1 Tax=Rubus argutus TaxID=59490 RepID=A0AAW1XU27_RUBAR
MVGAWQRGLTASENRARARRYGLPASTYWARAGLDIDSDLQQPDKAAEYGGSGGNAAVVMVMWWSGTWAGAWTRWCGRDEHGLGAVGLDLAGCCKRGRLQGSSGLGKTGGMWCGYNGGGGE